MAFRWLHLSDIHQKPEDRGRDSVYRAIIEHVKERVSQGQKLDAIFITGDLAWSGEQTQYEMLETAFLNHLRSAVGAETPFFMVPGNHDVDRNLGSIIPQEEYKKFFTANKEGQGKRRCTAQVRFGAYSAFAQKWGRGSWAENWLDSVSGGVYGFADKDDRKIAIAGFNTAWLCCGKDSRPNQDDHGLTSPGVDLVRHCLERLAEEDPDLTIALGHHPLAALIHDDAERLTGLFKNHKVLYLHGHLHKNQHDQRQGEALHSYSVQATAAFQAHDDAQWPNGLLWGEANLNQGKLFLEPLKHQTDGGWRFDSTLFDPLTQVHGKNCYWTWLPGRAPATPSTLRELPAGWAWLSDQPPATAVAPALLASFRSGMFPTISVALSPQVPRLSSADDIFQQIESIDEYSQLATVIWVYGPCGEGKSTAALQAAKMAVEAGWNVLFQPRQGESSSTDFGELAVQGRTLVVLDGVDSHNWSIHEYLRDAGSPRLHFLLVSHESHWIKNKPKISLLADVKDVRVHGLSDEDAQKIAELSGKADENAVETLITAAGRTDTYEGTLLGAVMQVTGKAGQFGPRLKALLDGLKKQNGQLLDAYALVAAMQGEGADGLADSVLASALGLPTDNFRKDLLPSLLPEVRVLDDEYIVTRHPMIATKVLEALVAMNGIEVGQYYCRLAKATVTSRGWGHPDMGRLRTLVDQFLGGDSVRREWALSVTQSLLDVNPIQPEACSLHARALLVAKTPREAVDFCRQNASVMVKTRESILEWCKAENSSEGDAKLAASLSLRGLADGPTGDLDGSLLRLASAALQRLDDKIFKYAGTACRWLLWRSGNGQDGLAPVVQKDFSIANAIKAIRFAAEVINDFLSAQAANEFLGHIGNPRSYAFDDLQRLLPNNNQAYN